MDDFDLYDAWLDSALTWAGRWKRAAKDWRKIASGHRARSAEVETLRARNHYVSNENGGLRAEVDRLNKLADIKDRKIQEYEHVQAPFRRAFEERDAAMQDRAVIKGRLTEALKEIERLRHALNLSRGEVGNLQTARDKLAADLEATRRALEGAIEKAKAAASSEEMAEGMEKMQAEIWAWRRSMRAVLGEFAMTNSAEECLKEITRRVLGLK